MLKWKKIHYGGQQFAGCHKKYSIQDKNAELGSYNIEDFRQKIVHGTRITSCATS